MCLYMLSVVSNGSPVQAERVRLLQQVTCPSYEALCPNQDASSIRLSPPPSTYVSGSHSVFVEAEEPLGCGNQGGILLLSKGLRVAMKKALHQRLGNGVE